MIKKKKNYLPVIFTFLLAAVSIIVFFQIRGNAGNAHLEKADAKGKKLTEEQNTSAEEESKSFIKDYKKKFFGMQDGNISLEESENEWYRDVFGLNRNMGHMTDLFYANGVYMALARGGAVYLSRDLKEGEETYRWKKANYTLAHTDQVVNDIHVGFLIIQDKKYFISQDGEELKEIPGIADYLSENSEIIFFKGNILSFDNEYKKDDIQYFEDCLVMKYRAEDRYVGGVVNDGELLTALSLENGEGRLLNSFDGIKWNPADIELLYDIYSRKAYGELSLLPEIDNKKAIEYFAGKCTRNKFWYSYEIIGDKVIYKEIKDG